MAVVINDYFRHDFNLHLSPQMISLVTEFGPSYGYYFFVLLELLCFELSKKTGLDSNNVIRIHASRVHTAMRVKPKKLRTYLENIQKHYPDLQFFELHSENVIDFEWVKVLEVLGSYLQTKQKYKYKIDEKKSNLSTVHFLVDNSDEELLNYRKIIVDTFGQDEADKNFTQSFVYYKNHKIKKPFIEFYFDGVERRKEWKKKDEKDRTILEEEFYKEAEFLKKIAYGENNE